jgi:hypothetical protein
MQPHSHKHNQPPQPQHYLPHQAHATKARKERLSRVLHLGPNHSAATPPDHPSHRLHPAHKRTAQCHLSHRQRSLPLCIQPALLAHQQPTTVSLRALDPVADPTLPTQRCCFPHYRTPAATRPRPLVQPWLLQNPKKRQGADSMGWPPIGYPMDQLMPD